MSATDSIPEGYYPPRATWRSRFYYPLHQMLRATRLDRIPLPENVKLGPFLIAFFVPGLVFFQLRNPMVGRLIFFLYPLCLATAVVALGHTLSGMAYGLMISMHATSGVTALTHWFRPETVAERVKLALLAPLFLATVIYFPVFRAVDAWCFGAYRTPQQVLVAVRGVDARGVHRGDWVSVRLEDQFGQGYRVHGGVGVGPVLALAGDRVQFLSRVILVNGKVVPKARLMPSQGEFVVPEKSCFVWSEMEVLANNNRAINLSDLALKNSVVTWGQLTGRVPQHWFGLQQY